MIVIISDEWEEWGNVDASKYVNDDGTIKFPQTSTDIPRIVIDNSRKGEK